MQTAGCCCTLMKLLRLSPKPIMEKMDVCAPSEDDGTRVMAPQTS